MKSSSLLVTLNSPPNIDQLQNISGVYSVELLSTTQFKLHYQPDNNPSEELVNLAVNQHWQLTELTPVQHSLEDIFMNIIQQESATEEQA